MLLPPRGIALRDVQHGRRGAALQRMTVKVKNELV